MIAEMSPGRRPPPPLYNTLLTGTPSAAFEDSDDDSASVDSYTKYSCRSNPPPPYPKAPTASASSHSTSALNTNTNSPFRMPLFPSTTNTTINNTSTSTAIVKRSPFIQQSSGSVIGGSPRIGALSGRNSSAPVKLPIPVKLFEASFL